MIADAEMQKTLLRESGHQWCSNFEAALPRRSAIGPRQIEEVFPLSRYLLIKMRASLEMLALCFKNNALRAS